MKGHLEVTGILGFEADGKVHSKRGHRYVRDPGIGS